jgi:hypothetical protein
MSDLVNWLVQRKLLKAFDARTVIIITPIGKFGYNDEDLMLSQYKGIYKTVSKVLWERFVDIQ